MSSSPEIDNLAPAFSAVTADDHAGWIIITSCVFLIFSFLALFAKLLIAHRRPAAPGFRRYDALLVAAFIFTLVQTVCVVSACKNGLGKFRTAVDDASFELVSKFYYSASILLIVSEACSKSSVAVFVLALSQYPIILNLCRGTIAVIVVWAITGITALGVQCRLPKPWISAEGACVDQKALYLYIAAISIITDVALVAIPIYLMFLTRSEARLEVIALFSARIVVPGFAIAYSVAVSSSFSGTRDVTRDAVMPTIWSQIALNLSIITACIPGLKRVIDAWRSDAAAISIAPPYDLAVSQNRYSTWLDKPINSLKSWINGRSHHKGEEGRQRREHQSPSIELEETQLEQRRPRAETMSSRVTGDSVARIGTAEWSGSTTRLTASVTAEEWAEYRVRAISTERTEDTISHKQLPQNTLG